MVHNLLQKLLCELSSHCTYTYIQPFLFTAHILAENQERYFTSFIGRRLISVSMSFQCVDFLIWREVIKYSSEDVMLFNQHFAFGQSSVCRSNVSRPRLAAIINVKDYNLLYCAVNRTMLYTS